MSYKARSEAKFIKQENKRIRENSSLFNGLSFEDPGYVFLLKVSLLEGQPFFLRSFNKSLFIDTPENNNNLRNNNKTNPIRNIYTNTNLKNNFIENNFSFNNQISNQQVDDASGNKFSQSEQRNQSYITRFHKLFVETSANKVARSLKSYNLSSASARALNYSELNHLLEFINNLISLILDKKRLLQLDLIKKFKEISPPLTIDLAVEKRLEFLVKSINELNHSFIRKINQATADLSSIYPDVFLKNRLALSLTDLNIVLAEFIDLIHVGRSNLENLGRNFIQLSRNVVQKPLNLLLEINSHLLDLEDNLLKALLAYKADFFKFNNLSSKISVIKSSVGNFSFIFSKQYNDLKQQVVYLGSSGFEETKLSYNETRQNFILKLDNLDQKFIHRLMHAPQMSDAVSIPYQSYFFPKIPTIDIKSFAYDSFVNLKNLELSLTSIYRNLVRAILEFSSSLSNNIAGVLYNIHLHTRKTIDEILSNITLQIKHLVAYIEGSRFHHFDLFKTIGDKKNNLVLFSYNLYNNIKLINGATLNEVALLQNDFKNNVQSLALPGLGNTQERYRAHKSSLLTGVGIAALISVGLIYNLSKQNENSDIFVSQAYGLYSKLSSALKASNRASINQADTNKFASSSVHLGKSFYSYVSQNELNRHQELHQNKSATFASSSSPNSSNFDKSEVSNDTQSLYQTALRYLDRKEEVYDPSLGAQLINKLAEQQFPPAQFRLGKLYEAGIGVPRNQSLALKWYKLAAEAGQMNAMHNSAVILLNSNEKRNITEALRWFKQAANLGLKDSQYNLGVIYAKGLSVKQDFIESYKWLYLAVLQGDKEAKKLQDEVGRKLSLEEIDQARDLAAEIKNPT